MRHGSGTTYSPAMAVREEAEFGLATSACGQVWPLDIRKCSRSTTKFSGRRAEAVENNQKRCFGDPLERLAGRNRYAERQPDW